MSKQLKTRDFDLNEVMERTKLDGIVAVMRQWEVGDERFSRAYTAFGALETIGYAGQCAAVGVHVEMARLQIAADASLSEEEKEEAQAQVLNTVKELLEIPYQTVSQRDRAFREVVKPLLEDDQVDLLSGPLGVNAVYMAVREAARSEDEDRSARSLFEEAHEVKLAHKSLTDQDVYDVVTGRQSVEDILEKQKERKAKVTAEATEGKTRKPKGPSRRERTADGVERLDRIFGMMERFWPTEAELGTGADSIGIRVVIEAWVKQYVSKGLRSTRKDYESIRRFRLAMEDMTTEAQSIADAIAKVANDSEAAIEEAKAEKSEAAKAKARERAKENFAKKKATSGEPAKKGKGVKANAEPTLGIPKPKKGQKPKSKAQARKEAELELERRDAHDDDDEEIIAAE